MTDSQKSGEQAGDREADLHEVHLLEVPVGLWAKAQEQTDGLLREFAGVSSEQEQQLFAAAGAGQPVIEDLVYLVPGAAAVAALGDMLDEADVSAARATTC